MIGYCQKESWSYKSNSGSSCDWPSVLPTSVSIYAVIINGIHKVPIDQDIMS